MGEIKKKKLRTFPDPDAKEFQHPRDATTTDALKSVPDLDQVVLKITECGLERIFYLQNISSNTASIARARLRHRPTHNPSA